MRDAIPGRALDRIKVPRLYPAHGWLRTTPTVCRRLAAAMLAVVVLGMLTGGTAAAAGGALRMALSFVILAALLTVLVIEGAGVGMKDAAVSFRAARARREGKRIPTEEEQACWHPLKAVCAGAIVFALPLLLCIFIAATAVPDLPGALAAPEKSVLSAEAPADSAAEPEPLGMRIWLRMIVRMTEMAAVGLFEDPEKDAVLLDRLAPLFMLLYPLAFTAGYCLGPQRQAALEAKERRAAWSALRRQKKSRLAEELTRGGGEVHYGHRAVSDQDENRDEQRRLI